MINKTCFFSLGLISITILYHFLYNYLSREDETNTINIIDDKIIYDMDLISDDTYYSYFDDDENNSITDIKSTNDMYSISMESIDNDTDDENYYSESL
jgi:hypothetical protein